MTKQTITWVPHGNSPRTIVKPANVDEVTEFEFTVPANAAGEKRVFKGGAYAPGLDAFRRWELLDPTGVHVLAQRDSQSPSFSMVVGAGSHGFGWSIIGLDPGATYTLRASPTYHNGQSSVAMPADFYVDFNNANWK